MKTRFSGYISILSLLAVIISCRQAGKPDTTQGTDSISLGDIKPLIHKIDTLGEGLPIFYNMYL
jgi:hypothetical protein